MGIRVTRSGRCRWNTAARWSATVSLIAVANLLVRAGPGGDFKAGLQVGFGVLSVVASWAVILFGTAIVALTINLLAGLSR